MLPSGLATRIARIDGPVGELDEAFPPQSVVVHLEDDLDVSRGDMLCRPGNQATVTPRPRRDGRLDGRAPPAAPPDARGQAHHPLGALPRRGPALPPRRQHAAPRRGRHQLGLNDIGRVRLRTTTPLMVDPYHRNRATGGFILVDEATNTTVGAAMLS